MAWLAVDKENHEYIFQNYPKRNGASWFDAIFTIDSNLEFGIIPYYLDIELPKGSIKKLIGRELSWEDEPVEI